MTVLDSFVISLVSHRDITQSQDFASGSFEL